MNRFVRTVPVAFVLGFAIAWTGKPADRPSTEPPSAETAADARNSSREPRAGSQRTAPALERVKSYLRRVDENGTKEGFHADPLKDIPAADIPLLIEQWRKRAGFSGLDYDQQYQIKKLVSSWYEQEPQAALDWVAGMECQKDRQELISEMVGAEAKRNLNHALELAKQYGKAELGGLDMPQEIQNTLGECDPARFMEIMRAFPSDGTGSSGSEVDFREDFDFAALAAMLDKERRENSNLSYSFSPSNFVSEWTKADPEAAWNWVSKKNGDQLVFNGADDFFETLAQSRSKEEINAFVIDQMAAHEDDDSKFRLAWQALASKPDATQIADFISHLPGDREMNLERLATASNNGSGGHFDEFKDLLVTQMTVEQRRLILPKAFGAWGEDGSSRRKMTRTLRQLGHTDAEISEMLPKRNKE